MKTRRVATLFTLAMAVIYTGCGGSADTSKRPFSVVLSSVSDDGTPIAKTKFATEKTVLGETDGTGRLVTMLTANEGQSVPLSVSCPEGYLSPEESTVLLLKEVRKLNHGGIAAINVEVTCERKQRDVLVVVRTREVASISVDIAGKTVGETGLDGTAHFHVVLDREVRSLSVSLQTVNQPSLRPQNPSRVFELDGRDSVLLVDQSFSVERSVRAKRAASSSYAVPKKRVPQRIDSARFRAL